MARRTIKDHHVRNLQKTSGGATYMITLPIEIIQELGWKKGQNLVVEKVGKHLIIKDYKRKKAVKNNL